MKNLQDAPSGRLVTLCGVVRPRDSLQSFVGRKDRAIIERDGAVQTLHVHAQNWPWLIEGHLRGKCRLGLFPTLASGRCRWGALDLDAHIPDVPDRRADALAVLEVLASSKVVAYMAPSRSSRGWHVFVLFDASGAPACDLHAWLEGLASELRIHGPVDVFPSSAAGVGRAIFLPGFGGVVDLLDVDLKPVPLDKLEGNPPSVIPAAAPSWPPRTWRLHGATGEAREFAELVRDLRAQGLVFEREGVLQARDGARNKIAGAIARGLVRRGRTFEDFGRWDAGNVPPLVSDEPGALLRWWQWALKRERQGRAHKRGRLAAEQ